MFVFSCEYVGLRAKCYASKIYDPINNCYFPDKKKCKVIEKCHGWGKSESCWERARVVGWRVEGW